MDKIYNKKFEDVLSEKYDMIITDPPYNIGFNYNEYKDRMSEDDYVEMLCSFQNKKMAIIGYPIQAMQYYVPALGVPDYVCSWNYNSNIPQQFRLILFYNCVPDLNKDKQPYKNPNDKRIKELIKKGSKGARLYNWWPDIQLVKNVSKEKTDHPCPVPEKLIERIIKISTEPGDIVFDPFMGSGTTAVAAIRTGRHYLGSEIDKEYYKISIGRIESEKERLRNGL